MGRLENLKKAQAVQIERGASPKIYVKGSPEAKAHMAKLRAMRKPGPRKSKK